MNIELKEILIKDLAEGYINDDENGVVGYSGNLNIRPKYQREFVYDDKKRNEVINTIRKAFPLNIMYWVENGNDTYEILDGQQRTISICEYVAGNFSINEKYFHTLQPNEQEQILNYKLMIYFCNGTPSEKLDWFTIINIAGMELSKQELKNAIYTGTWLTDAKKHFSKNGCVAYQIGNKYLSNTIKLNRQEYLEIALKWISSNQIKKYMGDNHHLANASQLWQYFSNLITWVGTTFPNYRKEMKGIDWGTLYNQYKDDFFDNVAIEKEISKLMEDVDVTSKKGIYQYILTREDKYLSVRAFDKNQIREAYERQNGICPTCTPPNNHYELNKMQADHITPWSKGGKTISENCKMLCADCNRKKSNI